ncbi:MAG: hypothetical protein A3F11_03000 [Gammaproteobacteria bacterium RIFCSPHIGHO2_12_FULL_37_14]|nr:MAG: hypothetical protein A3F11_03000 [Gammaproteobacteria bacterium RIFCSPHIGHO2_12_FULL_37_14]
MQGKDKIIAVSDQDASFLEASYPGLKFKFGDARKLPFDDKSIDVVFSSAVLEHVGTLNNQRGMISECLRVARKGIYLTTPNRWYPIETHTSIPFIHWLPKRYHRAILRRLGLQLYSLEDNLNLLDYMTISKICMDLGIQNYVIRKIRTFGFVSNLVLVIKTDVNYRYPVKQELKGIQ